jgi:hypothetical protein
MGITDFKKIYRLEGPGPGKDIIFAATGVTDGTLMRGVRFGIWHRTSSVIMQNRRMGLSTASREPDTDAAIKFRHGKQKPQRSQRSRREGLLCGYRALRGRIRRPSR